MLLFAVDPFPGAWSDLFMERLGKQILPLFTVDPLSGCVCGSIFGMSLEANGPEVRFKHFLALALEVDKMVSRRLDFNHFQALAPEVDKMSSRGSDLSIFWPWIQKSTK